MPKKSADNKIVRKSAAEVPPATQSDLKRLRAAMRGDIDTEEIPVRRRFRRIVRDASGRLPAQKSMIRDAVAREVQKRRLTVYRLWRLAQTHYPPLSQSAVHEFLKGRRQLELPSVEALLTAVDLQIVTSDSVPRA